ncbi:MAG: CopG family transcriptional regulator [Xanthomonadales bacterium]|nr:CopG family transcriptional regulator [Xanthomonadales bacterium]MCC6561685.1 CopG family transcriptional regulator [Xanthomonadales bacterium]
MGQLTIDLDADTTRRVTDAAAAAHMAAADWVAAMVRARVNAEWPTDVRALAGAWPDFPEAASLRGHQPAEVDRETW